MTDRELLELAAKAAGLEIQRSRLDDPMCRDLLMNGDSPRNAGQSAFPWNPLTDDGDALRLAVKLKLLIHVTDYSAFARRADRAWLGCEARLHGGIEAATRRAIVRAAAEIGKQL